MARNITNLPESCHSCRAVSAGMCHLTVQRGTGSPGTRRAGAGMYRPGARQHGKAYPAPCAPDDTCDMRGVASLQKMARRTPHLVHRVQRDGARPAASQLYLPLCCRCARRGASSPAARTRTKKTRPHPGTGLLQLPCVIQQNRRRHPRARWQHQRRLP